MANTIWHHVGQLVGEDRKELVILGIYTLLNGLLMLAVPLAAQSLVNTIAAGVFLQPLVVMSLLLLGALLFSGGLRLLQMTLVEIIQQRVFTKISLHLAYRLPRIQLSTLKQTYAPELANRFFDILTLQKTWSKLLIDGPSACLQILTSLLLLAFYSPLLLALDLFLILGMFIALRGLSWGGLSTSIQESHYKYHMASWLQEISRCHVSFKLAGLPHQAPNYLMAHANDIAGEYLGSRGQHFRVLFRQAVGTYLLYAIASAGILAIGGWLVINRQLTLGQLVASEIVVFSILSAFEKLMRLIEPWYDFLTGISKISQVTQMPIERISGSQLLESSKGAHLCAKNLSFQYRDETGKDIPIFSGLNFDLPAGEHVALIGPSGSGKSTLASLLCGLQEATHGIIELNGIAYADLSLDSLRQSVGWAGMTHEIFEGTLEENITLGRSWVKPADVRWALETTQLTDDLALLPAGKNTPLMSEGRNLSLGQRQRIMLARAIVDRPKLLILDEVFSALSRPVQDKILDNLLDKTRHSWSVILISHSKRIIERANTWWVIRNGQISSRYTGDVSR